MSRGRYWKAIDEGMCGFCYKRKALPGRVYCQKCKTRTAGINAERNKQWRKKQKDNHCCTRCGAPLEEDETFNQCFFCRSHETRIGRNCGKSYRGSA
jgi:hypothetical protein